MFDWPTLSLRLPGVTAEGEQNLQARGWDLMFSHRLPSEDMLVTITAQERREPGALDRLFRDVSDHYRRQGIAVNLPGVWVMDTMARPHFQLILPGLARHCPFPVLVSDQ